jgi:tetratricopeptide (TPR) repeat protein
MYSYYRLWPEKLRGPWEALSRSNPALLANHYEQLAGDEQMWGFDREALELWKLAVENAPKDSYKLFRLGSLYGELGQLGKAEEHLRLAVDLSPTWPQPAIELARVLLNLGQHQRALAHLSKLPREGLKQHVYGLFVLGNAFAANGHFGEASWAFRRLTGIQPDNAGAYADASLCLLEALKRNPNASDRKEAIRLGRELSKEAHLRGDSRAKVAWEASGKDL